MYIFRHDRTYRPNDSRSIYNHDNMEFFLCLSGQGMEVTEHLSRPFAEDSVFVYPRQFGHNTHSYDGHYYSCYVLNVMEQYVQDEYGADSDCWRQLQVVLQSVRNRKDALLSLRPAAVSEIAELFDTLYHLQTSQGALVSWQKRMTFERLVFTIVTNLTGKVKVKSTGAERHPADLVADIQEYVEQFYHKDLRVEEILKLFPVSRSRFFSLFLEYAGCHYSEFVRDVRIERAQLMLRKHPERPVTQIASLCGFRSQTYFSHTFRQVTGMTPRNYRER